MGGMAGGKPLHNGLASGTPQAFAEGWFVDEKGKGKGYSVGVLLRNEEAIVVMLDELRNAGYIRGHQRKSTSHGLHEDVWNPIAIAVLRHLTGQGKHVGFLIERYHFFEHFLSDQRDDLFKIQLTNQGVQISLKRSASDDAAAKAMATDGQQMAGTDERGKALFVTEPSHAHDGGNRRTSRWVVRAELIETIQIQTVVETIDRRVVV